MGADGPVQDEYLPILQKYLSGMQRRAASGDTSSYQTPAEVAQVILEVIEAENPPIRKRTSAWAEEFCQFKTEADPNGLKQTEMVIKKYLDDSSH